MKINTQSQRSFSPLADLGSLPFLLPKAFRKKKIGQLLEEKIEKVKKVALNIDITENKRFEYQIEYENLDNFFCYHFKQIESSPSHSFDEKIEYCLAKYRELLRKMHSPSNLVLLEDDFLYGAEKTLTLYFLIDKRVTKIKSRKPPYAFKQNHDQKEHKIDKPDTINLNYSNALRSLFKEKNLFEEFDFTLLKESGIIYDLNSEELKLNKKRVPSDIIILINVLQNKRIIELNYGKNYQKQIIDVGLSIGINFSNSHINKVQNNIGSKDIISEKNAEAQLQIEAFICSCIRNVN